MKFVLIYRRDMTLRCRQNILEFALLFNEIEFFITNSAKFSEQHFAKNHILLTYMLI